MNFEEKVIRELEEKVGGLNNRMLRLENGITFISSIMIRSGKSNLCIKLTKDIQKLVKRGEIYQVTITKLK